MASVSSRAFGMHCRRPGPTATNSTVVSLASRIIADASTALITANVVQSVCHGSRGGC